jgi:hypothetical protein
MKQPPTTGKCQLCNGTFTKQAMTRHLTACLDKRALPAGGKKTNIFVLQVQGKYNPGYWLYLEAPAFALLGDIDAFLRHIWLECCGHLSAFDLGRAKQKARLPFDSFEEKEDDTMSLQLDEALEPKMAFDYDYDFGSTTKLQLKVVGIREGVWQGEKHVRLLARNDAPQFVCQECGKPATQVNPEENYGGDGWYCDECAQKLSEEDEYHLLPVVNSPRVGVCAYTG